MAIGNSSNQVVMAMLGKEVCNGGVACSLLKLGSLEKTVIASLFHSGLHPGTILFVEKAMSYVMNDSICHFFDKKRTYPVVP